MVEPLRHRQTKEAATDMFDLKPPRHTSTYMRPALSRGISVVFSDLDSLWLRMWTHGQAPQPRSGAPKAQGLRVRPHP
jgi:hypothetical protein